MAPSPQGACLGRTIIARISVSHVFGIFHPPVDARPLSVPSIANSLIDKGQEVNEWIFGSSVMDNEVETAQWLRALAAIAEEPGAGASIHIKSGSHSPVTTVLVHPGPLSSTRTCTHVVHVHAVEQTQLHIK